MRSVAHVFRCVPFFPPLCSVVLLFCCVAQAVVIGVVLFGFFVCFVSVAFIVIVFVSVVDFVVFLVIDMCVCEDASASS